MSFLVLLAAGWFGLATAWSAPPIDLELAEVHFESFIHEYGRQYADEHEKQIRFKIFKDNLERYNRKNENSKSAVYGITKFSDLTLEEFIQTHSCLIPSTSEELHCTQIHENEIPNADAPESFDWRDFNVVTSVKNQLCLDCYSFSTAGNIEGQYAIKHKELVDFSTKQIVDCDNYDLQCRGGYLSSVFRYLIDVGGLETLADYPYDLNDFKCKFNATKAKAKLVDCREYNFTSYGHEKLKQLLYKTGPISAGIQAIALEGYKSGILTEEACAHGVSNGHAILLVGYGQEKDTGAKYWIFKNSYGTDFGENGYFRVDRGNGTNVCTMMTMTKASAILA